MLFHLECLMTHSLPIYLKSLRYIARVHRQFLEMYHGKFIISFRK